MRFFAVAHKEIIGFKISMKELLGMQEFNCLYHLVRENQDSFKREFLPVLNVEFLQTLPQEVHNHEIVVIICPTEINLWDSYVFITVVIKVIV